MMYSEEKTCKLCGKTFTAHTPTALYCPDCRDDSGHAKKKRNNVAYLKTCVICGKPFASSVKHQKYCPACKAEGRHMPKKCACCGQVYTPVTNPGSSNTFAMKYCPDCLTRIKSGERVKDLQAKMTNHRLTEKAKDAEAHGMSYGMWSAYTRLGWI